MVKVTTKPLLVPTAFVALNVVLTTPLAVGVPLISPLFTSRVRPDGNTLGPTTA